MLCVQGCAGGDTFTLPVGCQFQHRVSHPQMSRALAPIRRHQGLALASYGTATASAPRAAPFGCPVVFPSCIATVVHDSAPCLPLFVQVMACRTCNLVQCLYGMVTFQFHVAVSLQNHRQFLHLNSCACCVFSAPLVSQGPQKHVGPLSGGSQSSLCGRDRAHTDPGGCRVHQAACNSPYLTPTQGAL